MNSENILKIENLNCKDVISHICENLGEPDDSPLCIAIQSHISKCEGCSEFRQSLFKISELYKVYKEDVPAETHDRLIKYLGLPCQDEDQRNLKKGKINNKNLED